MVQCYTIYLVYTILIYKVCRDDAYYLSIIVGKLSNRAMSSSASVLPRYWFWFSAAPTRCPALYMRPDLYVHGKRDSLHDEYKNIVIDTSSSHPFPIYGNAPYTREKSVILGLNGKSSLQEKRAKYEAIATANNLKVYPIIFKNAGNFVVIWVSSRSSESLLRWIKSNILLG